MKKWKAAAVLILLFCMIPLCAALAKTGKVTASSLNLRKSASSDSKVVGTLREGDKVTIKDSSGSWYKVSKGSKTGYVAKKYIKVTDSSDSGSSSKSSLLCWFWAASFLYSLRKQRMASIMASFFIISVVLG